MHPLLWNKHFYSRLSKTGKLQFWQSNVSAHARIQKQPKQIIYTATVSKYLLSIQITLPYVYKKPANRFGHSGAPTLEQNFPSACTSWNRVIYYTCNSQLHVCNSIGRALVWFCNSFVSRLSDGSYEIRFVKWHPQNSVINRSPKLFDRRAERRSATEKLQTRLWQSRQFGRVKESLEIQKPNKYIQ